jgi:Uma2 family endonuclease
MPGTATLPAPIGDPPGELRNGDRLTQKEFHAIYAKMPEHVRAELIGGIVYMASPMKLRHGINQTPLGAVLFAYEEATPGTEHAEGATVILNDENEPQPDHCLRILPEYGGRSWTTEDEYMEGSPEFLVEVSDATRSLDLNAKKREYAGSGVLEYIVFSLREPKLYWFDLAEGKTLNIDPDGILRSFTYPGLWIDSAALFARKFRPLLATLDRGLATPEHAAFVQELAKRKK